MTFNLLTNLPSDLPDELSTTLLQASNLRIERIVSHGHASPEGFWYDQDEQEWVMVLQGGKRTAAYSVFWGRGACKCSVVDFAKDPAAPLTPHTSRPLHPTAWPPFSTGALAGGVRGGGAEGADRA
jgi:hypothetical protein